MDSFRIYPKPTRKRPYRKPDESEIKFVAILRDERLKDPVQELDCTSREQAESRLRSWLEVAACNTGEVVEVEHG